jgi:hypothetical protein
MIADKLKTLFETIKIWFEEDIPQRRLQLDRPGRMWYVDSVGWGPDLKLESLRKATDRAALNAEYVARFKEENPKPRKGISALKTEISQLYSFNKCWVLRHKSRMLYYQDDLAQKNFRNMYNNWQSFAVFKTFKEKLDT